MGVSTYSPLECAQGCIDQCQSFFAGEPQVYADCLYSCQSGCPGGAPERTDYAGEDFCLGAIGLVRCTTRGVAQDASAIVTGIARLAGQSAAAALSPIVGSPQVLIALAVVAAAVVVASRVL